MTSREIIAEIEKLPCVARMSLSKKQYTIALWLRLVNRELVKTLSPKDAKKLLRQ